MPCYSPWPAWELEDGSIVLFPREGHKVKRELPLPCNNCVGCKQERSREWAIRCIHEAQMHDANCFITLTYNDEHIPHNLSLDHRDFQKFMKRLRKRFTYPIRYYMCGEYGETFTRPHFHACLFGHDFADKEPIKKLQEGTLYTSKILDELWGKGFASLGKVTFQSAAYVARYVMKKQSTKTPHYTYIDQYGEIHERTPEYNKMSLKPGIGAAWLNRYATDVYPSDQVITNGHPTKPPRYYDKILERNNPQLLQEIKDRRETKQYEHHGDNTTERLKAKETVAKARMNQLKRKIT